jgi:hypothetical protein
MLSIIPDMSFPPPNTTVYTARPHSAQSDQQSHKYYVDDESGAGWVDGLARHNLQVLVENRCVDIRLCVDLLELASRSIVERCSNIFSDSVLPFIA